MSISKLINWFFKFELNQEMSGKMPTILDQYTPSELASQFVVNRFKEGKIGFLFLANNDGYFIFTNTLNDARERFKEYLENKTYFDRDSIKIDVDAIEPIIIRNDNEHKNNYGEFKHLKQFKYIW